MEARRSRFAGIRRRPMFFGAVALAAAGTVLAAAGYVYYKVYDVKGEMRLDDGTVAPFEGQVVTEGEQTHVEMSVDASGSTAGGAATFVTEDGRTVQLNVVREADGKKAEEKKPE